MKVLVLGHEHAAVFSGQFPDARVCRTALAKHTYVQGIRKEIA
jgi:hypothetical protein